MAFEHVRAVAEGSQSKSADRHVLSTIALRINYKSHIAWPSIATIACECGCSPRHVKNAIPRLEQLQELVVRRSASDKSTHVYSLGPRLQALADQLAGKKGVNLVHQGGAHHSGEGEQHAPEPVNEVHPNLKSSSNEISPETEAAKKITHQLVADLRAAGIPNVRFTEQLVQAVLLGAKAEHVIAAVQAVRHSAGDPFAYGVKVIVNRMQTQPQSPPAGIGWEHAPRSVVEAKGEEIGIGKWNECEQWPKYKARVASAARVRQEA